MSNSQISTFVNTDGEVILSWALTEDGDTVNRAIALSPEEAAQLGQALVLRARKARSVRSLFESVRSLFDTLDVNDLDVDPV